MSKLTQPTERGAVPNSAISAARNGWKRESIWFEPDGAAVWGDNAVAGFQSFYVNGEFFVDDDFYVERTKTYNQPEVVDTFVVTGRTMSYRRNFADEPIDEETTYDHDADVFFHPTFEEALAVAWKLAARDYRDVLYVPEECR